MKKITFLLFAMLSVIVFGQTTDVQTWNFDNSDLSVQGNNTGMASWGTLSATNFNLNKIDDGFGSTNAPGFDIALTDNLEITVSVTTDAWNFDLDAGNHEFRINLRNSSGDNQAQLNLIGRSANTRTTMGGSIGGVSRNAGVVVFNEVNASPLTYGLTLSYNLASDPNDDTYTYWIGTPTSGSGTWGNRFAEHTGTIAGGIDVIDTVAFAWIGSDGDNNIILDQFSITGNNVTLSTGDGLAINENTLRLYPNPVNDKLNISSSSNISKVTVFNLLGKQLFEDGSGMANLDVSQLSKGVYIAKFHIGDNVLTKRFVKQ